MREKIAELVWQFDDRLGVDYKGLADQILKELSEEIEKGLLTDEERMAVNIPCETCKEATPTYGSPVPDFDTTVCLDCAAKCHNKAQLQKILAQLK